VSISLVFPDKYRVWSDLLRGNTARTFIAAENPQRVGSRIAVELTVSDPGLRILVLGTVVGRRRKSQRFAEGMFVRFPSDELEKCRRLLGISQDQDQFERGRRASRVDCQLPLRFTFPQAEGGLAKNLSASGLLASCPVPLVAGQPVELTLSLDDGTEASMRAEVSWARSDVKLYGLKFVDLGLVEAERLAACIERLSSERRSRGTGRTILIADDEPQILEMVARRLATDGYEIHKATRGDDALAKARELRPRLILLDVLMPGVDGVDVCRAIRADVETGDVPIILVSALDPARLEAVADEAGATDCLTKPVSFPQLLALIDHYLKD
jgi:CheY-like chemotaxis protein